MSVYVAEYLGQRTDVQEQIDPVDYFNPPMCPFMDHLCTKVNRAIPQKPVCSVRMNDRSLWIVCEHRLCSTRRNLPLSNHQQEILLKVANAAFSPNLTHEDILVNREVKLPVSDSSSYKADYVMRIHQTGLTHVGEGQSKVVLEMQGGGETSNTKSLSDHVSLWENNRSRTNEILRVAQQKVNPIVTNAWRRQQEQFLVKGNIAVNSGGGIIFCVGSKLYNYLAKKLDFSRFRDLRGYNWTLALFGFTEDNSNPPTRGPIPLIIDPDLMLFTNYSLFINALINQGDPHLEAFTGSFVNLNNEEVIIP